MDNQESFRGVPAMDRNELAYEPAVSPTPHAAQVDVDDSRTSVGYANFCRLTATPEELLIDCGVNLQQMGVSTQPIMVTQRVVTGWYTAKRLIQVLQLTVDRHETAFGVLETNVHKRVRHA